jgi:hypothetical protein
MKKKIVMMVCGLALVLPQFSSAYTTTSQTALRLSDDMLMFLVTYQFGHEDFSYRMPVAAKRGGEGGEVLGYDILTGGKLRTNVGETVGVVLSDASMKNGKYEVAEGEAKEFTLVTFLTLPKDRTASSTDFALAVSSLPFELGKDGVYTDNKLNPSELTKYQTAVISTDKKIGITTR